MRWWSRRRDALPDTALERYLEQLLSLDRELHRELVDDLLGVAADDQADGTLLGDAPLAAVEELVLADLGWGSGSPLRGRCGPRICRPAAGSRTGSSCGRSRPRAVS